MKVLQFDKRIVKPLPRILRRDEEKRSTRLAVQVLYVLYLVNL